MTLTDMPKFPMSAYAVLLRQNGMRTPPMMPTRLVVVTMGLLAEYPLRAPRGANPVDIVGRRLADGAHGFPFLRVHDAITT
jgi:hypothetical protein